MLELISLLRTLAGLFRDRRDLVVENLLLRHQLHVALRSRPRSDLKTRDRFFWMLVRRLVPDWKQDLILVQPENVVRWHRQGWRLYWRRRLGHRLGRPRLSPEVRELIATMASANRLWGTERIRGELLKLGIVVSSRSIRRHRRPRQSPIWSLTFPRNLTKIGPARGGPDIVEKGDDLLSKPHRSNAERMWYVGNGY
jgi:putative transposase